MSTSKQAVLDKAAKSIANYLDNVSDQDFLATYNSVATNEGLTINAYLTNHYVQEYFAMCEFSIHSVDEKYKATIIDEVMGEMDSIPNTHAANDDYIGNMAEVA